jgi:hypothetical protein
MFFPDLSSQENAPLVSRRSAIGTLGLAGLGLAASASSASAFLKDSTPPIVQVKSGGIPAQKTGNALQAATFEGISSEWAAMQGSLLVDYTKYLKSLKLQRIAPEQVIAAHAKQRGQVWNRLPPKQWWTRMGYTVRVIDRIAVYMNMPVEEVVSAYRCPIYNAQCEGAKVGSWHQANVAVDVKFPVSAHTVTATTRNLRDRGLFKGGVGSYPTFTHIDTRGTNINWG